MSYPIDLNTLKRKIPLRSSPVAQLVEQVTVNHRVAGSIPARGAIILLSEGGGARVGLHRSSGWLVSGDRASTSINPAEGR
jgi:hypothetical protein